MPESVACRLPCLASRQVECVLSPEFGLGLIRDPQGLPISIETDDYTIEHLVEGEPRTVSFGYGTHAEFSDELEDLVLDTLNDKCAQIEGLATDGHPSFLLMDCRTLLWPEPRSLDDIQAANRARFVTRIISAGDTFLAENRWVKGIIWWWKKADWPVSLSTMIHEPAHFSKTTPGGYIENVNTAQIAAAIGRH